MNNNISIGFIGMKVDLVEGLKKVAGMDITIQEINLDREIEDQGKFDLIVHKPSKYIAKHMMSKEGKEVPQLKKLTSFEKKNPGILLDPIHSINILCDRDILCQLLDDFVVQTEHGIVKSPAYASAKNKDELGEMLNRGFSLKYPVICKPFVGDGNDYSHQCAFAHNEKGLQEMELPAIFQQFHDHDAVIYKIYVLGDEISQLQRPSLDNYDTELQRPDFEFFGRISNARENGSREVVGRYIPSMDLLVEVTRKLRELLPMTFFGFDLICDTNTGTYYIIDINYMPGYYGVKNLNNRILHYLTTAINERRENTN